MVLGKKVAIWIWNGAEIQPLEMGRKSPAISLVLVIFCEPVNVETESRNFSASYWL